MKVEVTFNNVAELQTGQKYDVDQGYMVTTIKLQTRTTPAVMARLTHLAASKAPLYCTVGSDQAQFDVAMEVRKPDQLALNIEEATR